MDKKERLFYTIQNVPACALIFRSEQEENRAEGGSVKAPAVYNVPDGER
jgi:hypothetical protein